MSSEPPLEQPGLSSHIWVQTRRDPQQKMRTSRFVAAGVTGIACVWLVSAEWTPPTSDPPCLRQRSGLGAPLTTCA